MELETKSDWEGYGGSGAVFVAQDDDRLFVSFGGQLWQEKEGSNLNLRWEDPDPNAITGLDILWDATIFFNAGDEIAIPKGRRDGWPDKKTLCLYYDGDTGVGVGTKDEAMGFNRMRLGVVTTGVDKADGTTSMGSGAVSEPI